MMTIPTPCRQPLLTGAALTLALFAAGCQDGKILAPATRIYAADLAGKAKACTVPAVQLADAKPAAADMTIGNDGGWCGISLTQGSRRPYAAGLVQTRANHGQVYIHTVGDETRVDYTPDANFAGKDTFAIRLLPGNAILNVAVTVAPHS